MVDQLRVGGVLSVPFRVQDQPVGTLDVYASQPRAWTPGEVEALGALAVVTAELELVGTGVELAVRDVEVAPVAAGPGQSGLGRAGQEGAGGHRGVSPDAAFQQLRKHARASSPRLAEQALQAAQTGLAQRVAARDDPDERARTADALNHLADQRDRDAHGATGPPAIPSSAVGSTKRQRGTSEAAPNSCG